MLTNNNFVGRQQNIYYRLNGVHSIFSYTSLHGQRMYVAQCRQ